MVFFTGYLTPLGRLDEREVCITRNVCIYLSDVQARGYAESRRVYLCSANNVHVWSKRLYGANIVYYLCAFGLKQRIMREHNISAVWQGFAKAPYYRVKRSASHDNRFASRKLFKMPQISR